MTAMIALIPLTPEQTNTIAAAVTAIIGFIVAGAVLYPLAQAYARRLEGRGHQRELEQDLNELAGRVADLEGERHQLGDLHARLEFAERLLAQGRLPPAAGGADQRSDTPPEPAAVGR